MPNEPEVTFDYFIFAWPGWEGNALLLARQLLALGRHVRVLGSGSNSDEVPWLPLDANDYFGEQFRTALDLLQADVLVHIQADATIVDMAAFVSLAEEAFLNPRVGIWAPNVDYTFWRTARVALGTQSNESLGLVKHQVPVVNTDCTCWALRSMVVERLRTLELDTSHFGWGLDFIAAAVAYLEDLVVVRDTSLLVTQPKGTGYATQAAEDEYRRLLEHLPADVRGMVHVLRLVAEGRVQREERALGRRLRRFAKGIRDRAR